MPSNPYLIAEQRKNLETLHDCSNALRDLKLLQDFLTAEGGSDIVVLTRHTIKGSGFTGNYTYNLRMSELRQVFEAVEIKLRKVLHNGGYDTSSIPSISQATKQTGG